MNRSFEKEASFSVAITDIALPNDYGVARHEGKVVFVPGGLPGDVLKVRVRRTEPRYAFADIIEVVRPSQWRVEPPCPHFGLCGGCSMQHLAYGKQLEIKTAHLREVLRRIGGIDGTDIIFREAVPSPESFHYRGKIELAACLRDGEPLFGLRERDAPGAGRAPAVVPVSECRIFDGRLKELLLAAEAVAGHLRLEPYDEARRAGALQYLVVRRAQSTGQTMVIIEAARGTSQIRRTFALALAREAPWVDSIYSAELSGSGDYRVIGRLDHHHGLESITEEVLGLRLEIRPASFFQPNPGAAEVLYRVLTEKAALTGAENILGLFCGIGSIELLLSRAARFVTGVDSLAGNILNAEVNAALNGRTNCTFLAATAEQFLGGMRDRRYDRIVVDPPRTGMGKGVLKKLGASGAPLILYVSCSPPTLARDLAILRTYGYRPREIIPFDFFPHTSHLETLSILARD